MQALSKAKQKWIRSLQLKKNRDQEMLFVVEGEKSVLEGLSAFASHLEIIVSLETFSLQIPSQFHPKTVTVTTKELEQISELKTPNKCIAVFKRPDYALLTDQFTIALDGIQDPGNMGTILRLADWFGVKQIVCSKDTVDCYNSKVIQASMGAIYRIPVHYTDLASYLKNSTQQKYGAMLNGKNYKSIDYPKDGILIMGNEGKGVRPEIEALIDFPVTIPRFGEAESLNVATATAILLAEIIQ
ncbi:RNA methyltransferase [uncultured Fluviicola sp.]|uniref:TrmH family RNA methyltransferase n=1 Tax=uncultured Fluviicola sp. TaxID=463303 RepID=UPI0025FC534A|nr:RNA methyltransferase [uncultured Fluviicola sp.]